MHGAPFGSNASGGQALFTPSQFSATSHCPASGRQTVVAGSTASGGQFGFTPSHSSATSHTPPAARHTRLLFPAGWWHAASCPLHSSSVHGSPSSGHAVWFGWK